MFVLKIATKKNIKTHKKGGSYILKEEFVKWVAHAAPVFGGQAK